MTAIQAKYWSHWLTSRGAAGGLDRLSRSIAGSRVDLHPHQVDAALFAIRSPLSKGVLLADEVGLGKTIEAGLVVSQRWAERRRRILLIVPASLRTQWAQEMEEKFQLPGLVLDAKSYAQSVRTGTPNPFRTAEALLIASYQFVASKRTEVGAVPWDLVVIDEAHRLRNAYKPSAKTAAALRECLQGAPKVLLTATPLQNSLMELYGLVSFIDSQVFCDEATFREQFLQGAPDEGRLLALRRRIAPLCTRTLRRQVLEYVQFTKRIPFTQEFYPSDAEQELYDAVSAYLARDNLHALPVGQRHLLTLVLRKLLASSSAAIGGTLERLLSRLRASESGADDGFGDDFETLEELREEWAPEERAPAPAVPATLAEERGLLEKFVGMATRIRRDAKAEALLVALRVALDKATQLGAARKAVVFTESRRTQEVLAELLQASGYAGGVVLMNGTNTDPGSTAIYEAWRERHAGEEIANASRALGVRAAIVEEFRDRGTILLATEAAAEGINLQFCSLVVNYDLPWNPQRIEQRIGRCHRYGQLHDVVVVNFLNKRNAADQRVYELLSEKFRLFDGMFGASDEVLGSLESGIDLERRIAQVYETCRTPQQIASAFDELRNELEADIRSRLETTRRAVLDNFDAEVHERLRVHRDRALATLSQREKVLLNLARFELRGTAEFAPERPAFHYTGDDAPVGWYTLDWKEAEKRGETFFRLEHPLAAKIVHRAKERAGAATTLRFDYAGLGVESASLSPLRGRSGWLAASSVEVASLDTDEFLVLVGEDDEGRRIEPDVCARLIDLGAEELEGEKSTEAPGALAAELDGEVRRVLRDLETRNAKLFDEEVEKVDRWSDDLKAGLERDIKGIDLEIGEERRASLAAASLAEKLEHQKRIKALEAKRSDMRRRLFDQQDQIDARRATVIADLEARLEAKVSSKPLFTVRWRLD